MPSLETLYLAAILNAVFQIALLVSHQADRRRHNLLLAALVGLIAVSLWNVYTREAGLPRSFKIIDYTLWATPYFWMPTLYLYIRAITKRRERPLSQMAYHYIPGLSVAALQIPLHRLSETGIVSSSAVGGVTLTVTLGLYLQMGGYFVHCFRLLNKHDVTVRQNYSNIGAIGLRWLRQLTTIFAVLITLDFALSMYSIFVSPVTFYNLFFLSEALAIFAIGYFALANPTVFNVSISNDTVKTEGQKYSASSLDEESSVSLAECLKKQMVEKEAYRNNELRLVDLADMLQISTHHLSQVINQQLGKNFYDFVNEYRAAYAAEFLANTAKVNITKLAFDAGFNNRVSFNNAFKKFQGRTPTAYHRECWPR